jgi:hypothetical protein
MPAGGVSLPLPCGVRLLPRRDLVPIQRNTGLAGAAALCAIFVQDGPGRRMSIRMRIFGQTNFRTATSGTFAMADQLATEIIQKIKAHAEPDGNEITVDTELGDLGIHSLE